MLWPQPASEGASLGEERLAERGHPRVRDRAPGGRRGGRPPGPRLRALRDRA
ncbi:MAG: hypothetical protein M0C28_41050 [Candidatus Moduliflexus flocculans]|nr:hypothetical protein [Candidatus Moduliflexus flocculans]